MTRANVVIIRHGQKTYLEIKSDGFPHRVVPALQAYVKNHPEMSESLCDLELFKEINVCFGHVGNPTYFYDVNVDEGTVKARRAQHFWVQAPENWRGKGYVCYRGGPRGEYGYPSWRRGEVLADLESGEGGSWIGFFYE